MRFSGLFVLLVLACVGLCQAQSDGYSYVPHSIHAFQTADGGFSNREGEAQGDLKSTADASVLAALYGLAPKTSLQLVSQFLSELENSDGGYAPRAGEASTVAATLQALSAQKNFELPFTDVSRTAGFLRSLYDDSTGLFGSAPGSGKGDVRSTAQALQALEVLGQLQSAKALFQSIRDQLSRNVKGGNHFSFVSDRSPGENNYWGIVVGVFVGYDFGNREVWTRYIADLAQPSGGYAAVEQGAVTFESTRQAVHALMLLGETIGEVRAAGVFGYARAAPRTLHAAADAHLTALFIGQAEREYRITPSLERADGSPLPVQIVQGTSFRAVVRVENTFGSGVGASVTGSTKFGNEAPATAALTYNAERRTFIGPDLFDTDNRLGPVQFKFTVVRSVAPYAPLHITAVLDKLIGFGINVQASAKGAVTGRDIAEGETVSVGTEFTFDVSLYRSDRKRFTTGDFEVALIVLDSSKVVLHRQTLDGKTAKELVFTYTLSKSNLPPPRVFFDFEVSAGNKAAAHTVHEIYYTLASTGVATNVKFSHKSVQLGQTQVITMQPASLDGRTVQPFEFAESRVFFADIRSAVGGPVARTVKGSTGRNAISFDIDLPSTLASLGTHFVSFRFQAFDGSSTELRAYDSVTNEEVDSAKLLNFTVDAKLALTDVNAKQETSDLFYGNEVTYEFKVKDLISGKPVTRGTQSEDVNVFLTLRHVQAGANEFTSASAPAVAAVDGTFTIAWKITPNAVRGPGVLVLSARGLDGHDLPLYDEKGENQVRLNVNIGGDIDVEKKTYSTNNPDTSHTAIVARFSLTCRGNSLDNAELVANLRRGSTIVARDLQVASSATSDGVYEVSWAGSHKVAPEGRYTLEVFRETDKARVVESKGSIQLEPLFTVDLDHEGVGASQFLIPPEVVVIGLLGAATVFVGILFNSATGKKK